MVAVIDQFEELFTHTVDDAERRVFLQMVVDVANDAQGVVRLVATLRADYFDRPLGYPGFGDAIKGRTVALGATTAAELAEAIHLPAAGVEIEIEPALVDRITTEAALQPGALPLVQYTMVELFARRETNAQRQLDQSFGLGVLTNAPISTAYEHPNRTSPFAKCWQDDTPAADCRPEQDVRAT